MRVVLPMVFPAVFDNVSAVLHQPTDAAKLDLGTPVKGFVLILVLFLFSFFFMLTVSCFLVFFCLFCSSFFLFSFISVPF